MAFGFSALVIAISIWLLLADFITLILLVSFCVYRFLFYPIILLKFMEWAPQWAPEAFKEGYFSSGILTKVLS